MCGRYTLFTPKDELEARFGVAFDDEFEPRYNAAPGQQLPVITNANPDRISRLEWGLIPRWAGQDPDRHINARAETVAEKPAFAEAYERRRCLVPADGFYEWVDTDGGSRPYRIAFEDGRPFSMAGLWERWTPEARQTGLDDFGSDSADPGEAEPIETFTVLTTSPNELINRFHHRMAVVLGPDEEDAWLDGEEVSFEPADSEPFDADPVSTAVNDPANDRPELVVPVDAR